MILQHLTHKIRPIWSREPFDKYHLDLGGKIYMAMANMEEGIVEMIGLWNAWMID